MAGKVSMKRDVFQNYYGLDIRENLDDVTKMTKTIGAPLLYVIVVSTDKNPQQHLCPDGLNSWCGYKRDKGQYKHKNGIPK